MRLELRESDGNSKLPPSLCHTLFTALIPSDLAMQHWPTFLRCLRQTLYDVQLKRHLLFDIALIPFRVNTYFLLEGNIDNDNNYQYFLLKVMQLFETFNILDISKKVNHIFLSFLDIYFFKHIMRERNTFKAGRNKSAESNRTYWNI